jgi:hypothetical protein
MKQVKSQLLISLLLVGGALILNSVAEGGEIRREKRRVQLVSNAIKDLLSTLQNLKDAPEEYIVQETVVTKRRVNMNPRR